MSLLGASPNCSTTRSCPVMLCSVVLLPSAESDRLYAMTVRHFLPDQLHQVDSACSSLAVIR